MSMSFASALNARYHLSFVARRTLAKVTALEAAAVQFQPT